MDLKPRSQTRCVGTDAYFACESETDVKWLYNQREKIPYNAREINVRQRPDTHILKIENVDFDNDGAYSCGGRTNKKLFLATGNLHVVGMFYQTYVWYVCIVLHLLYV